MSLPDERTRSVIQAGELLRELAMHPELPEAVRLQSKRVLRHYPAEADIFRAGAVDEKLREVLGRLEAEGTLPQELRRLLLPEPLFCPRPKRGRFRKRIIKHVKRARRQAPSGTASKWARRGSWPRPWAAPDTANSSLTRFGCRRRVLVVKPKLQAAFADIIGIFEILGSFMIGAVSYSSVQASFGSKTEEISRVNEQTSAGTENLNADATQTSSKQTISNLARQLAASASRAEARDKTLNRSELADKAKNLLGQISGDSYQANKKIHDGEVPKTSDPELLARAKQATEFINRSSNTGNEKNPFSGLSRDQLSNIVYDESGTYTVNERRAAWMESSKQEEVWREKVIAQAIAEYNESGKLTNFFSSVLDHFKELPAIEQAQYPKDYVSDLESKIKLDFNYRTHQAEGKGEDPVSLIETLFAQTGGTMASKVTSAVEQTSDTSPNQGASSGMQTISTLARQLAASTSRAEERDRTLTRSELADKAKSILNQTVGDAYYANKARHDGVDSQDGSSAQVDQCDFRA